MKRILIVSTCLIAAVVSFAALASERSPSMSIDKLLSDFDKAIADTNAPLMKSLFLPPDDSKDGENRNLNLTELIKDWNGLKNGPRVSLSARNAVIVMQMEDRDPERRGAPRRTEVELKIVRTDDGWRIASMR